MLAMAIMLREPWLSGSVVARSTWVSWTGGIFGAIYIAVSILLLPRLGAATVVTLIVVGQLIGSLVFDHFGVLDVPVHPVNLARLIGAAFLILGAVLIRF
jgi:transporter family-2 protein